MQIGNDDTVIAGARLPGHHAGAGKSGWRGDSNRTDILLSFIRTVRPGPRQALEH